jgi:hypothetical protein
LDVRAIFWNRQEALTGAVIHANNGVSSTTDANGRASLHFSSGSPANLQVSRDVPTHEGPATDAAVNLQDAVAILKMIAGLPVNGGGVPVARAQSLAADFDGSGEVSLADALGVLRHAVGRPAPAPSWVFVGEGDDASQSVLNPGIPGLVILDPTPPVPMEVNLIGILRGDVDGSFVPSAYGVYQG